MARLHHISYILQILPVTNNMAINVQNSENLPPISFICFADKQLHYYYYYTRLMVSFPGQPG